MVIDIIAVWTLNVFQIAPAEELFPVRCLWPLCPQNFFRTRNRGGHDLLLSLHFASLKSVDHLRFGLPSVVGGVEIPVGIFIRGTPYAFATGSSCHEVV